jgi:hypothetical protein
LAIQISTFFGETAPAKEPATSGVTRSKSHKLPEGIESGLEEHWGSSEKKTEKKCVGVQHFFNIRLLPEQASRGGFAWTYNTS